ncbi:uncharacterized protein [Ptychodera flava]|uniref:uncharacterized protein n=1 Tax=Ptychodera flava TaxID=63121 RepID=UPI00396AA25B
MGQGAVLFAVLLIHNFALSMSDPGLYSNQDPNDVFEVLNPSNWTTSVSLTCNVSAGLSENKTFAWFKNGVQISSDVNLLPGGDVERLVDRDRYSVKTPQERGKSTLHFTGLTNETAEFDNGNYICAIIRQYNNSVNTNFTTRSNVTEQAPALTFDKFYGDLLANFSFYAEEHLAALSFRCGPRVADHAHGHCKVRPFIVGARPRNRVSEHPEEIHTATGTRNVSFLCNATLIPTTANYTWTVQGRGSTKLKVQIGNETFVLTNLNTTGEHAGTCAVHHGSSLQTSSHNQRVVSDSLASTTPLTTPKTTDPVKDVSEIFTFTVSESAGSSTTSKAQPPIPSTEQGETTFNLKKSPTSKLTTERTTMTMSTIKSTSATDIGGENTIVPIFESTRRSSARTRETLVATSTPPTTTAQSKNSSAKKTHTVTSVSSSPTSMTSTLHQTTNEETGASSKLSAAKLTTKPMSFPAISRTSTRKRSPIIIASIAQSTNPSTSSGRKTSIDSKKLTISTGNALSPTSATLPRISSTTKLRETSLPVATANGNSSSRFLFITSGLAAVTILFLLVLCSVTVFIIKTRKSKTHEFVVNEEETIPMNRVQSHRIRPKTSVQKNGGSPYERMNAVFESRSLSVKVSNSEQAVPGEAV